MKNGNRINELIEENMKDNKKNISPPQNNYLILIFGNIIDFLTFRLAGG